jgi:hypothetical protein
LLARTVVQRERDDGEDVRRPRIEDERLVERRPGDGTTLRPEPAGLGDGLEVETPDGGLDLRARAQILSITCLTTV